MDLIEKAAEIANKSVPLQHKKRRGLSSVQRTIRSLRVQGTICDIAEKFNAYVGPHGVRQDLFGFIDIVALAPGAITAIQCCVGSGYSVHLKKILDCEHAYTWLESGGKIELWAWRKVKVKRGGKLMLWQPRIKQITERDFLAQEVNKNGV